jgi:hypothetical protein
VNKLSRINFFKKAYLLLVCLFFYQFLFSQEIGFLTHFHRKFSSNIFILPKDSFEADLFQIKFPSDLYDSGLITLKNPTFNQIKFKMAVFQFKKNEYISTKYCTKKKNEHKIDSLFQNLLSLNNSIKLTKTHERRSVCFEIKKP